MRAALCIMPVGPVQRRLYRSSAHPGGRPRPLPHSVEGLPAVPAPPSVPRSPCLPPPGAGGKPERAGNAPRQARQETEKTEKRPLVKSMELSCVPVPKKYSTNRPNNDMMICMLYTMQMRASSLVHTGCYASNLRQAPLAQASRGACNNNQRFQHPLQNV